MINRTLIICPTYKERENISPLIQCTLSLYPQISMLFIDDHSPDGTADEIVRQQRDKQNIYLLSRSGKQGLGSAYVKGFSWGLQREFDYFITMDADLSHHPKYLKDFFRLLKTTHVVIGSRLVDGGGSEDLDVVRRMITAFGSFYARSILNIAEHDLTSGYVGFQRTALERLGLANVRGKGFIFQVETKYLAKIAGCRVQETPIIFIARKKGKSKLSLKIALEAAIYVWQLRWRKRSISRHR